MRTFSIPETTPVHDWPNEPEKLAAISGECERLFKWRYTSDAYSLPRYVIDTCYQAGYDVVIVVSYTTGINKGSVMGLRRAK